MIDIKNCHQNVVKNFIIDILCTLSLYLIIIIALVMVFLVPE